MYVPPDTLDCVEPEQEIELIPTLSLTTAVKITVWLWDEVTKSIELSFAEKEVITGPWSSSFVIFTVILVVELLPALSVTVRVGTSVCEP